MASGPFAARLATEIPALSNPAIDDFERVNSLREWAYAHIPLAAEATVLLDNLAPDYLSWPIEKIFETFERDAGALWAYGTANVFARMCRMAGLPAAVLRVGERDSAQNHYVTIVRIEVDGKPRFVLEDAYFDFALTDVAGRPLDWSNILGLLRERRSMEIVFSPRLSKPKTLVFAKGDNGRPPFTRRSYSSWGWYGQGWLDWSLRNAVSTNSLYALLYPLSFSPIGDPTPFDQVATLSTAQPQPPRRSLEERHERLARCIYDEDFEKVVLEFTRDELRDFFSGNPWRMNQAVNVWEFLKGEAVLTSYPRDICIPIADVCNARCTFCTSWLEGTRMLKLNEMDSYRTLIEHAFAVGLAGHGEPLSHPQIKEILARLQAWLNSDASCYLITNGVFLRELMDDLLRSRVTRYAISLNGATAATHREVMGLEKGAFEDILASIRRLVSIRDGGADIRISISLVITAQNVHETADFVRLGNELRENAVQLKTLAGQIGPVAGLNYHMLPPYQHPEFERHRAAAIKAIEASKVEVLASPESWETPVFPSVVAQRFRDDPPPFVAREDAMRSPEVRGISGAQGKFAKNTRGAFRAFIEDFDGNNPYRRVPRYSCKAPYYNLYINDFSFTMVPCCYLVQVPGHDRVMWDGTVDFFDAWNSSAMVALRTRLRDGPLFDMCTKCPAVY